MRRLSNRTLVCLACLLLAFLAFVLFSVRYENAELARQYRVERFNVKAGMPVGRHLTVEQYTQKVTAGKASIRLVIRSGRVQRLGDLQLVNTPRGTVNYFDEYRVNGHSSQSLRLKKGLNVIEASVGRENFGKRGVKSVIWYKTGPMKYSEYFLK